MDLRLDDPDPRIRDLANLLFLDELLGGEWVERWARERGKLDALREWQEVAWTPESKGPPATMGLSPRPTPVPASSSARRSAGRPCAGPRSGRRAYR